MHILLENILSCTEYLKWSHNIHNLLCTYNMTCKSLCKIEWNLILDKFEICPIIKRLINEKELKRHSWIGQSVKLQQFYQSNIHIFSSMKADLVRYRVVVSDSTRCPPWLSWCAPCLYTTSAACPRLTFQCSVALVCMLVQQQCLYFVMIQSTKSDIQRRPGWTLYQLCIMHLIYCMNGCRRHNLRHLQN